MSFSNYSKSQATGGVLVGCFPIILWLYFGISWIVNLIKLVQCDFAAPWRDEIIHGIGVFTVFGSGITVWF